MSNNLRKGLRFESQARDYLQAHGLLLLQSNYRCRFGEIDLVMRDRDTLCFIEVKFRKSMLFGGAAASIPRPKQRKIVKTALFYISAHKQFANQAIRFDALLIQRQADSSSQIDWIQSAFYAE
jgi:putative endonuclease